MKPISGTVDFFSHMSIAAQVGIMGSKKEERFQRVFFDGVIKCEKDAQEEAKAIEKEKLDAK